MTAQYLLRFDDLCPTMDRARWQRFLTLLTRYKIKPILAVVPDNCDPDLEIDSPNPAFWDEMRELQADGATIGLHGYRHICAAAGRSLIPVHGRSEFAGVVREAQHEWVQAGTAILRDHGLEPRIWVAPRHGFDAITLSVLRAAGIQLISDGFATRPFTSRGVTWIPQQLWGPVEKQSGLWTICVHADTATEQFVEELGKFLERFASQFTTVDRVMEKWPIQRRSVGDWIFHVQTVGRMRLRRAL